MRPLLAATVDHDRLFPHPHLARLVIPKLAQDVEATAAAGVPWMADNGAFTGFDEFAAARFERMLDRLAGLPGCRFVTCPDVVGEAGLTDLLFEEWAPAIAARRLPIAYVVQEHGCEYEPRGVPWGPIDALFIGCATDEVKLSPGVAVLAREARARGKWVHWGRVNSRRRIRYAVSTGACDSFDGTCFSRWDRAHLADGLRWCGEAAAQPSLFVS